MICLWCDKAASHTFYVVQLDYCKGVMNLCDRCMKAYEESKQIVKDHLELTNKTLI